MLFFRTFYNPEKNDSIHKNINSTVFTIDDKKKYFLRSKSAY